MQIKETGLSWQKLLDINIGIIPVKCTACGVESSSQTHMELVLQLQDLVKQVLMAR